MSVSEVAEGVYRLGTRWANFYLVVEGYECILVDAGYPQYFTQLRGTSQAIGVGLERFSAVIVTHHHVDHAGTAEAVRSRSGADVLVGVEDTPIVRGERPSHPPHGFWREAWRPSMFAYLLHSARTGGARCRPVAALNTLEENGPLALPGRPRIIRTPGHTASHSSVFLPERGVLLAGDAMVNFDYVSGKRGLKLQTRIASGQ